MKKRILCFVLTMAMVLSMLVVIPAATVSADTTVEVGTKAELEAIATAVNAGTDDYSGKTVVLTADIDLDGSTWTSIGNSSNPFRGSFNGNGHTISNMTRSGGAIGQNVGLFGVVSSPDGGSTTIQNFKITGSIVSNNGGDNAGTVVSAVKPSTTGTVTVNITGVWSAVNFDAGSAKMTGVGGILGTIAWCTNALQTTINIDSCRYSGTMDSPSAGSNDYGGIFGYPKEACGPRTVNITNCLYDGVMYLRGSAPDDNGGIVGYFKGNGGVSAETHINIQNCIVAGQFNMPNKTGQTVTGYVVSEASGSGNTGYNVTNVYYCNDSDRSSGGTMGGWYGYYKNGSGSISGLISYSNVTAKTMTQLKAMTSGSNFADDSKWYFGESSQLPIPAMIYDNIIANVAPSCFADLSADEFTITTADEMMEFASLVNGGTTFSGKTVKLGNDINLAGLAWQSIGKSRGGGSTTFRGTFDGQGYTISNMTSTVTNADGEGGLFGYVVYSATIKNFKLTGTITANATSSGDRGYYGTVIGCVFQETATITLQNVWSSVNIVANNPSAGRHYAIGGLVGWIRNATGTFTLNIDSCVYDGDMNISGQASCVGGILGGTNNNSTGRDLTINITNTVCAAAIHLNNVWSSDVSMLIGYIKGNGTNSTGPVNVNLTDVISTGIFYFYTGDNRAWDPASKMYGGIITSEATGDYAYVTATNLYYRSYDIPTGDGSATTWAETGLYLNTPSHSTVTGGAKMTPKAMSLDLTTESFTDSSKWNKTEDYIPCPKSIVDAFGLPTSLYIEPTEIYVGTADALNALATAVNGGKTYEGKTILITNDITIESGWTSIGITSSRPFMGNFNGQGHTIEINQTLSNPDGVGGLIAFVRTPAGGTCTIENVHVTGTISATNTNSGSGYFGGVAGCVDGNTSGSGGTINFNNVWCSLYINAGLNNMWTGVGGFIGFVRHADGLKPLTLNFDSCVWDGTLNAGPAAYHFGGFVGYTGNNKAGRTLTINIENSVASGKIAINQTWDQYAGLLVGYARGGYTTDDATAKVTVNVSDVVSTGYMTFAKNAPGSGSKIGHVGRIDDTTNNEINMTNLYYNAFGRGALEGNAPALGNGEANTNSNVVAKTVSEMVALSTSSFADSTKWTKTSTSYPCPASIVNTFGAIPESLVVSKWDLNPIEIDTVADFLTFRDKVNDGISFSGKTILLTSDIDLTGEEWQEIGRASGTSSVGSKVFKGTFDGQGHTISNMTTYLEPHSGYVDMQGGLFGNLGDGAIVKNFNLTGSMTIYNRSSDSGTSTYFGSVANAVSGTVVIQNVISSVDITTRNGKNPDTDKWAGGVAYAAGLVGFILHNNNANLTIDGCEYAGTINCANSAVGTAGIISFDGNNNNESTKVITISNTFFSGKVTLNDNGGAYTFEKCGGIMGCLNTATLTIENSSSGGQFFFNRTKAWTATNISAGQIIGQVNSTASYDIDSSVTYTPIFLYTALPNSNETKFVLGEIGYLNGTYAENGEDNTDAIIGGMIIEAEARNTDDAYKGVRFVATYYNYASCHGASTASANFGMFIMTKDVYDILAADGLTKAELEAAANIVKVAATKAKDNGGSYTVSAVVYNLGTDGRKATQLVAVAYAGSTLGETVCTTSYNALFN